MSAPDGWHVYAELWGGERIAEAFVANRADLVQKQRAFAQRRLAAEKRKRDLPGARVVCDPYWLAR